MLIQLLLWQRMLTESDLMLMLRLKYHCQWTKGGSIKNPWTGNTPLKLDNPAPGFLNMLDSRPQIHKVNQTPQPRFLFVPQTLKFGIFKVISP